MTRHAQSLSTQESRERLAHGHYGRVVFTEQALPAVLPVPYLIDGDSVVFSVPTDSKLAQMVPGTVLAFEVDELPGGDGQGWSVTVTGEARQSGAASRSGKTNGHGHVLIELQIAVIEGHRLVHGPA